MMLPLSILWTLFLQYYQGLQCIGYFLTGPGSPKLAIKSWSLWHKPWCISVEFSENCPQYCFMAERSADQFVQSGIDLRICNHVESVDSEARTLRVRNLKTNEVYSQPYDRLLIATGASAIHPPIENLDIGNVFFLKTMEDGFGLKKVTPSDDIKDVVVAGGGYIGLEVVEAMKEQGKNVRLIVIINH